jgi:SPP1 family predicted phage head-tail adaptor
MLRRSAAGQRTTRIEIEAPVEGAGNVAETWSHVAFAWAWMESLNEIEIWRQRQSQSLATHRFSILRQSGITTAMRIRYGARRWKITGILGDDPGSRELKLLGEEERP